MEFLPLHIFVVEETATNTLPTGSINFFNFRFRSQTWKISVPAAEWMDGRESGRDMISFGQSCQLNAMDRCRTLNKSSPPPLFYIKHISDLIAHLEWWLGDKDVCGKYSSSSPSGGVVNICSFWGNSLRSKSFVTLSAAGGDSIWKWMDRVNIYRRNSSAGEDVQWCIEMPPLSVSSSSGFLSSGWCCD